VRGPAGANPAWVWLRAPCLNSKSKKVPWAFSDFLHDARVSCGKRARRAAPVREALEREFWFCLAASAAPTRLVAEHCLHRWCLDRPGARDVRSLLAAGLETPRHRGGAKAAYPGATTLTWRWLGD
jgi:hypothetical protein